jgi:uncharacterized membrane protein
MTKALFSCAATKASWYLMDQRAKTYKALRTQLKTKKNCNISLVVWTLFLFKLFIIK